MLVLLREGLYESGFAVVTATDAESAIEITASLEFDSIILDVGLPRMNGYELARLLRQRGNTTPVLMLTARDREDDIICGFDCGVDDYLTKPFSFAELVARLRAITRIQGPTGDQRIVLSQLSIDPLLHITTRGAKHIDLTRHEFLLLLSLARKVGTCVSRKALMQSIWGHQDVASGTLDVLVNALRAKIDDPFNSRLIQTVRGSGYMLVDSSAEPNS